MDIKFDNRKVMLTETILRDAHQSQAATRMRIDEMLPVLEQLDEIGYYSIEAWGGATFDSCLRFLNEDPWERLRTLKSHLKTPIQMLLRGQNLLGYRHYADDVVEKFVAKSIENGVGVIRVFDALNDPRNLEVSMQAIKNMAVFAKQRFAIPARWLMVKKCSPMNILLHWQRVWKNVAQIIFA